VQEGPSERPDAVVEGDPAGLFHLVVDRDLSGVTVRGNKAALRGLLETLPARGPDPTPFEPEPVAA
jgi:hypothetical protein